MSILHAIVLGIVQGLTEFFPVSSSGHLVIVPWLFGWDDFGDNANLGKAFDVALHIGTLFGAIAYFRHEVVRYFVGGVRWLVGDRTPDGAMAWRLALSAVPAAITGLALNPVIDALDDEVWLAAVMLIAFSFVLLWADRLHGTRVTEDFDTRDALFMGVAQALALQPGVSRSGVTMTAARYVGFDRTASARLSFLMSLPVIAGAGLFSYFDVAADGGIPSSFYSPFLVGMATAAVTGYLAVWATIKIVSTRGFTPFVIYRVVLGVSVLLILFAR